MSKLTATLHDLALLLANKIKHITLSHKKKIVFLLLLLLCGYIAKKKLNMAHLITFVDYACRAAQYIPLPEAPRLRLIAEYEHPETHPLRPILEAIRLSEIKERIARKQSSWQQVKQSIFVGAVATLITYNAQSLYFLVHNKYREDFAQLSAGSQFQEAMYIMRKSFRDQVPHIFSYLRILLSAEIQKIELTANHDPQELHLLFKTLTQKVYADKFHLHKEVRKNTLFGRSSDAKNRLLTVYEQTQQKKSVFTSIMGALGRTLGGVVKVYEWFPEPKVQLTTERYQLAKIGYLMSLKKADVQGVQWTSVTSRDLFQLVQQQIQQLFLSLNFSTLLHSYCEYNLRILATRVSLLMTKNKRTTLKISQFLPSLYKILQEEFLKPNQYEFRDKYHDSQLKKALRTVAQNEQPLLDDKAHLEELVLQEIEAKKAFQYLEKEFELKYFNERSGIVMHARKGTEKAGQQSNQMQKLLNMMGGSEVLNSSD